MKIEISGDYGDPKADDIFWPLQRALNDLFEPLLKNRYFNSIREFSIVFRVSGRALDFKSEGPELLKYNKKSQYITIDLTFPESAWKGIEMDDIKMNVVNGLNLSFDLMIEKAIEVDNSRDLDALISDFKSVMSDFIKK